MISFKPRIDWYILLSVTGLMMFSMAFVYSASAPYALKKFGSEETLFLNHTFRIFIGFILLLVFAKIDYHFWQKISKGTIFVAVILLILVLLTGSNIKGSSRWLPLGPLSFQPTEFAKFALVLHLSTLLVRKQNVIKDFQHGLLPLLIWTGAICFLIILQPNNSSALVIFFIAISMMFIGNTNILQLGIIGFIFSIFGLSYAFFISKYPLQRIYAFLGIGDMNAQFDAINYQLQQSLIAFGNGGIFGLGPGQSRQSNLFLPESYGDFIFAVIGEEYGFVGALLVILAFVLIFWRGMKIAKRAPDNFGYFLSIGIIITFSIYAFVNAGVNSGILPTSGLPMPFISYGGTAILFHASAIGVLLNISRQAGVFKSQIVIPDTEVMDNNGK